MKEEIPHPHISHLYSKVQRELQSYFRNPETIEKSAARKGVRHEKFVHRLNEIILANIDQESFCIDHLCEKLALSRSQLYRKIKMLTHMAPAEYIQFFRLQKARELLQDTDMNINEIAFIVGFSSHSHFSRAFHRQFGFNPSSLKK